MGNTVLQQRKSTAFYVGKDQRRKGKTEDYKEREKVGEKKVRLEVEENPLMRRVY